MDNKDFSGLSSGTKKKNGGARQFYIGPKGLIFFLLALLVLCAGFIGYLEYDRLVKPYFEIYFCCIPAMIIAVILLFFGFATRVSTIHNLRFRSKGPPPTTDRTEPYASNEKEILDSSGRRKYEPTTLTKTDLTTQKQNLVNFLKDLDDQNKDGLIMDSTYINLKNKYKRELSSLNTQLKDLGATKAKKIKVKQNK